MTKYTREELVQWLRNWRAGSPNHGFLVDVLSAAADMLERDGEREAEIGRICGRLGTLAKRFGGSDNEPVDVDIEKIEGDVGKLCSLVLRLAELAVERERNRYTTVEPGPNGATFR